MLKLKFSFKLPEAPYLAHALGKHFGNELEMKVDACP